MKFAQVMLIGALTAGVQAIFLNQPKDQQIEGQKGGPRGPKPDWASMSDEEIEAAKEEFGGHICRKAGLSQEECDGLSEADIKELAEHLKAEFESLSDDERDALYRGAKEEMSLAQKGGKPDWASMSDDEIDAAKEAFGGHICRKAGLSQDECDALSEADIKELAEHLKAEFESMSDDERDALKRGAKEEMSLAQKGGKPDFASMSDDEIAAAKRAFGGHICRKAGLSQAECDGLSEADIKELAEHLKAEFESLSGKDQKDLYRGAKEEMSLAQKEGGEEKPAKDDKRGHVCRLVGLSKEECDSISDEDLKAHADDAKAYWESLSDDERDAAKAAMGEKKSLAQKEGGEEKPAKEDKPRPSLEDLADEFGFDVADLDGMDKKEVHEYLREVKEEQFEDGEFMPTQEEIDEHLAHLADKFDFDVEELDGMSKEEVHEFLEEFFDGEDGEKRGPKGPRGPKGGDDSEQPSKEGKSKPAKQ